MNVATDPWFVREPVGDGLWHVWEQQVDPFARCNIWIVRGRDRVLVVDTGLGVTDLHAAVHDLFDAPPAAVATHYHFDHAGSLHEFAERWVHRAGADYHTEPGGIWGALTRRNFAPDVWKAWEAAGYDLPEDMLLALPYAGYDVDSYAIPACPPTRLLDEGDVVDLGDRAFTVLHLPGHSPDSIGLYDEANGVLFSGDAVYDGPLIDGNTDSDVEAYATTMERLRALPVTVVHGGHDPSFGRDRLVELCDEYLARVRKR